MKAFIFDMDGVIIDSEPLQLQSFNKVLQRFGHLVEMDDFKHKYMGLKDAQICERMVGDYELPITPEEFVDEKRRSYLEILQGDEILPMPGVVSAIKKLYQRVPLAIASSSNRSEIETITERFGIRQYFKVFVSAHEVSSGKPAPDVYLKTSEELGVDPTECGVIEDTLVGIRSAKAAGMYCVGITTTHTKDELKEADKIITSFEELLPALEREYL